MELCDITLNGWGICTMVKYAFLLFWFIVGFGMMIKIGTMGDHESFRLTRD
jgi:hypothetical protein